MLEKLGSSTINLNVKSVSALTVGAVNEVEVELEPVKETLGPKVLIQAKDKPSPSGSELATPSSVTGSPSFTTWSGPAFATGGLFAAKSITVTVPGRIPESIAYTSPVPECTASPLRRGVKEEVSAGIVFINVSVAPLITEIVPSFLFETYILLFAESTPTSTGLTPTGIVAITVLVAVSITETVSLPLLAVYTLLLAVLISIPSGPLPMGIERMKGLSAPKLPRKLLVPSNTDT